MKLDKELIEKGEKPLTEEKERPAGYIPSIPKKKSIKENQSEMKKP